MALSLPHLWDGVITSMAPYIPIPRVPPTINIFVQMGNTDQNPETQSVEASIQLHRPL